MDFDALRARTLRSGADEEAVTVNTRALIDKVLARYSGEWTVLRELLQNAADASATKVIIKFETIPSATVPLPSESSPSNLLKHTVQHHTLKRLVVTNNGTPFSENDWNRLKRIAEGNPDETKIGAFGVGFYSTFADCENPFVSSGKEAMAFFWKNNYLFTRRLQLPESETTPDTNFVLDYRDTTSPVPPLLPLAQFLANSLTFVGLENIELWLDEWNVLSLKKKTSPSLELAIPRNIEPKTSEGFMKVTKVSKEIAQIDGQWMAVIGWKAKKDTNRAVDREAGTSLRKFFSRLAGTVQEESQPDTKPERSQDSDLLTSKVSATVFLNVNTATIKTFTGQKFNEELERATKKPPPKFTKLAILTAPYIEDGSLKKASAAGDVFGTVLPSRGGKIFIGFPTHQTRGLSAHISAPSVIPTVERESIDLNARYVRTWNVEMLRAAGIVCRIAWSSEMQELKEKMQREANGRSKIRIEEVSPFLDEAITVFKNFTFRESTPSQSIGQLLEDAFWTCSKEASIEVVSTCGVLPTHQVRVAPKDLSFMEGIPIIPERLAAEAKDLVNKLVEFGLITEVTVSDIKKALESNPLTPHQVSEFLGWLTKQSTRGSLDRATVASLLGVAVASDEQPEGRTSPLLPLGEIRHFLNPSRTPVDLPVPPTVMPFKFTKSMSKHELESLGWEELQLVTWVRWLISQSGNRQILAEDQDMTRSPEFSAQVLPILSKQWDSLSQPSKTALVELLSRHTVVPTKFGMKKPGDSYFPNVKLFDDLATIKGLGNVKDKFLVALGVRKTVELGVVFERLLSLDSKVPKTESGAKPQWSHVDLIHYLASVREDIPGSDIAKLRSTPICPRHVKDKEDPDSSKRYKVSELFEPRPDLRELGLPVLAWPGVYRSSSPEGKFLSSLGLRTTPGVEELVAIMARAGKKGSTQDLDLRDRTLAYFLSHHHAYGYSAFDYSRITNPFLPLENKPDELATPSQCFADEGAALLGFDILKRDWVPHATKFGVRLNPPMDVCINALAKRPPTSYQEARAIFAYFAGRLNEINISNIPRLNNLDFVPIFPKNKEKSAPKAYTSPRNCFLGESDVFGEIFHYVDFGFEGNAFLIKCGSKQEPSKMEIAQILVREPARISATFRNAEKYMALLRSMADDIKTLKKNKELFAEMKKAPFLLASKELPAPPSSANKSSGAGDEADSVDEEEAQGIREFQLCSAQDAIIIDDYLNYNLFKTNILAAPQEESLEDFYFALGSPLLSSLVEEAARHGPRLADQKPAQKLQKQILERSTLFLHEQPPDTIKHDAKWLEKNLTVQLVSSISLRRSLRGRNISHTEKRSAVVTQVNREYTLWIAGEKPDLYQVSQALVHILLTRPKLHSAITLEMLLKTDLLDLRARGFNVSRILRQKAAEARLAESKRQQELEEQQNRIQEEEKKWQASQQQAAKEKAQHAQLPGGFPDSPDHTGSQPVPEQDTLSIDGGDRRGQGRNLFSNLSRQLGLGSNRHLQSMLGQNVANGPEQGSQRALTQGEQDPPPPYQYDQQGGGQQGPNDPITAPHRLRENLLNAIKKSRPHNSSDLYSRGETNVLSETKSYCDEHPAHDLTFVADIQHGIQMYLSPSSVSNSSGFLQQHSAGLTGFATLLKSVGEIFSLDPRTLNIFFETSGKTIAFNRNGSIFCNYRYYEELHERSLATAGSAANAADAYADAFVYWWVILCHELAHNLVGDHSSDHSYYTEGFVAQYFGRVMKAIGQQQGQPGARRHTATAERPPLVEI
ncbi:hypothetical protein HRR83_001916 [Exophiala dermatitidis]|uniref:Sacsin/Nov domain-containing protein n=1 Tax=Exophiala dermatitidis TaxID=5970 RepID=A0AAN6IZP4_EXODE|nr:hypothetical protein HRR73_005462 [Exophiala dermatitidis]KAJ4523800.1 hypothetical protein HRR74_001993 [Exophiala dermatitidis]KAJ4537262.1 hypothetical protein HRR76_005275 [Exophiala dermatitidis]KAJ4555140.1 hypothetical protein HRR77_001081 [Exophiala dermatitidis]KAJ4556661.1 hypothetical protein HRR78_002324 [Exophiala dermatitidis]